jgi:hypothetical protein
LPLLQTWTDRMPLRKTGRKVESSCRDNADGLCPKYVLKPILGFNFYSIVLPPQLPPKRGSGQRSLVLLRKTRLFPE